MRLHWMMWRWLVLVLGWLRMLVLVMRLLELLKRCMHRRWLRSLRWQGHDTRMSRRPSGCSAGYGGLEHDRHGICVDTPAHNPGELQRVQETTTLRANAAEAHEAALTNDPFSQAQILLFRHVAVSVQGVVLPDFSKPVGPACRP
jgi:hypothetical protein